MQRDPQTWHYGLVAKWWEEFNDDFRPHEVEYYRAAIDRFGEPVLDAGCGAGRLLVPFLTSGIDIDGSDVSADMIEACRRKAAAHGLDPNLYVQPMHAIDTPRRYQTILVVGSFGLGSNRERDLEALRRMRDHLAPGGTLLVDIEAPYADPHHWPYWISGKGLELPEPSKEPTQRRTASDGSELALTSRIVSLDPLEQRMTMEIVVQQWRDGVLDGREIHELHLGMYFKNEMLTMLRDAGFSSVEVHGEHQERPPSSDDEFLVFIARP